ncbi:MAG: hypothetical protein E7551_07875, partial [Ruminococcaceae bacterium]|nr:hypothetical protein [Oscillospiraceae bacterium]
MKRLTSIILSFVLIFSSVTSLLFVSTSAQSVSGTVVEDFESYTINSAWGSGAVISSEQKVSGNNSLYFAKDTSGYAFVYNSENIANAYVEQGKTYRLRFNIRVQTNNGALWYHIADSVDGLSSETASTNDYLIFNSSATAEMRNKGWQEKYFDFTADKSGYLAIGKNSGTLNAYIDDIVLSPKGNVTISFVTNTEEKIDDFSGEIGSQIGTLPTPVAEDNKIFAGWYTDSELSIPFADTLYPNGNITLYAKWVEDGIALEDFENYSVNPTWGSGAVISADQKVSGNNSLYFANDKKGFAFIYNNNNIAKAYVEKGKSYRLWLNIRVQTNNGALWYHIADSVNGLTADTSSTNDYLIFNSGATAEMRNKGWQEKYFDFTASKSGYLAIGKNSGTLNAYLDDILLCPQGSSTISFEPNNGEALESINGFIGSRIGDLPIPVSSDGSVFDGWYTDQALTVPFKNSYYPINNITLYAKWQDSRILYEDFEDYSVNPTWGSGVVISTDQKVSGNNSLYFANDKKGFTFIYNQDNIAKTYVEQGKSYRIYMNVRVQTSTGALWYYIADSVNGLSSETSSTNDYLIFNSSATAEMRNKGWQEKYFDFTASKSGYLAIGKNSGTLNIYFDDILLCPQGTSTISFETNNSETLDSISGAIGSKIGVLPKPAAEPGKGFEDWYTDSELTVPFSDLYFTSSNIVLYAKWSNTVFYDYYETADNWHFYEEGHTLGGDTNADAKWYEASTNITDNSAIYNGGEASVKINANTSAAAIKLNNVEIGKRYDFTFYYYVPTTTKASSLGAWLNAVGIYQKGTSVAQKGAISKNIPALVGGSGAKVGEVTAGAFGDASWHSYTLTFAVTEQTGNDLYFAFRCAFAEKYIIYLDAFSLTENNAPSTIDYYETASNWHFYDSEEESFGGLNADDRWYEVTTNQTDKEAIYGDGEASLKLHGHTVAAAVKLQNVEIGKNYKVSFRYYAPETSQMASNGAYLTRVGIYKAGTSVTSKGTFTPATRFPGDKVSGESGKWYEYSLIFRCSEKTTSNIYFAFWMGINGDRVIYLDDFKVEDYNEYIFDGWESLQDEYVINFDDFPVKYDMPEAIVVDKAPERDGKVSNATHILAGEWDNSVMGNFNPSLNEVDPAFNIPVEPNTKYSMSYLVYVEEGYGYVPYFGMYFDYFSNNVNPGAGTVLSIDNTNVKSPEFTEGRWIKYEARFTTRPDQTMLRMTFNAGKTTVSMWIDDITVKKVHPGSVQNVELNYCEDAFNLAFEDETVKNDVLAAKSGVYKITTPVYTDMVFGITVNSSNKNSNSKIYLS